MLITFNKYKELCYRVLNKIDKNINYYGIITPLKGAYFLSYFLSRNLNLPMLLINIHSYENKKQKEIIVENWIELKEKNYLIADDIYDTGNTIECIKNHYPDINFDIATLVSRQKKDDIIYGKYIDTKEWIDFFWEVF